MWNDIGDCYICLKAFGDEGQPNEIEYRKNVLLVCSTHLVAELGVDWSALSLENYLPFCAQCLDSIEKISKFHENHENIQSEIRSYVSRFIIKAVRRRKQMKEKGVTLPPSLISNINPNVKIEHTEHQNCVACYDFYTSEDLQTEDGPEMKNDIVKFCKKHLYSDFIINSDGFDWNTIPQRDFIPFCSNCFVAIRQICELGRSLMSEAAKFENIVDTFLIEVFECRDSLRKRVPANRTRINESKATHSLSVQTKQTKIVISSVRTGRNEEDCFVSASSDKQLHYIPQSNRCESGGPRIGESSTIRYSENVSTTSGNQRGLSGENTVSPSVRSSETKSTHVRLGPQAQQNRIAVIEREVGQRDNNVIHTVNLTKEDKLSDDGNIPKPKKRKLSYVMETKKSTKRKCDLCQRSYQSGGRFTKHRQNCQGFPNSGIGSTGKASPQTSVGGMPELQMEYPNYPDVQIEPVPEPDIVQLQCPWTSCNKKFEDKINLDNHLAQHFTVRPFQCRICMATFAKKGDLNTHMRNEICGFEAEPSNSSSTLKKGKPTKDNRNSNTRSSAQPTMPTETEGSPAGKFICRYCDFTTTAPRSLSTHMQKHYLIATTTSCSICHFVYSHEYALKCHMSKKHPREPAVGDVANLPFTDVLKMIDPRRRKDTELQNSTNLWVKTGFAHSN